MAAASNRQLALLRGINVGKHKQLPMAALRELLEGLGHTDVVTHLRSGNAVYATKKRPATAAREIERAISERFGFEVDVLVRTASELDAVLKRDPFGDVATDGAKHLVAFLSAPPSAAARHAIEGAAAEDEQVRFSGSEAYLWCPRGISESRAWTQLAAGRLGVVATARNWNTVRKLAELLAA